MVWITTTNPVTSRGVAPLDSPKREVAKAPAPDAPFGAKTQFES